MAELVQQYYDSLASALEYLQTIRFAEIRQAVELLGVKHFEIVLALAVFVLLQCTKFTAVLILAFGIATCIFYMWETWFPELGNPAKQRKMYNTNINKSHLTPMAKSTSFGNRSTPQPAFKNQRTYALLPPFTYNSSDTRASTTSSQFENRRGFYPNGGDIVKSRRNRNEKLVSQLRQQRKMYAAELAATKAQYQYLQCTGLPGYSIQRQSNHNVKHRRDTRQPVSSNNDGKQRRSNAQPSLQSSKRTNDPSSNQHATSPDNDRKTKKARHKNSSRKSSKKHYFDGFSFEKYLNDPGGHLRADFLYRDLLRAKLRSNAQSDSYAGPSGVRHRSHIADNQADRLANYRASNVMSDLSRVPIRKEFHSNRPKPPIQMKNQVENQIENDSDTENENEQEIRTTNIR